MTFLINHWYLFVAAVVSGGLLAWPVLFGRAAQSGVSPAEAVGLLNRERAVLIDVSEPAEYASGHASGSKNVPFGTLEAAGDLPKNKALPLLLLCPTGARANRGAAILRKRGYDRAHAVAGGVAAWREANLPIERTA